MNTQTGSYIALAGVIVTILAHYNIIISQDSIITIIAGIAALYGIVHQFFTTKTVVTAARVVGAVTARGIRV